MISVGERIRQLRIAKGVTQEELAAALNTTKAAISRYELSQRELRFSQSQAIAEALGVSVFELYGFPSEQQQQINSTVNALNIMKEKLQQAEKNSKATPEQIKGARQIIADTEQYLQEQVSAAVTTDAQIRSGLSQSVAEQSMAQGVAMTKQSEKRFNTLLQIFYRLPDDGQNRAVELLSTFEKLTSAGQKRAVGRVKELAEIPRYQQQPNQE
ncbi:MAG: helix-turn-helix transcriptional regulator [Lawsonibacter sp.]|nr:helix-turn-helix transcriptional regulator [Lawsonibacter sp.]